LGGVGVVWVGDGGGDVQVMTVFEESQSDGALATRTILRVAGYSVASGILGFFFGSLIGLYPGLIAFRSEPSRVILWMRFDQFLAIMALSCGLVSLAIIRLICRDAPWVFRIGAVAVGSSPWILISTLTAGGNWFRIGGALAGFIASIVITVSLTLIRRFVLGLRVAARQEG